MIKFVDYDSEKIISELVAQFESVLGETLQPSDERRIFLNTLAQVIVGIKANINDAGNQVLLRYARGEALDAIGEMLGVERLPASNAKCTLKFTLSAVQKTNVIIPKGTRATPDGNVYFATDAELIISAGATEGTASASATEAGAKHNDFTIGQVKYIVDNVQFLESVANITASSGGADEENDDSLRERIRLVPESFSTAGCTEGYIYWAKSASADVGDVMVDSPSAGVVRVCVLKADGTIPSEDDELLSIVSSKLNEKDKRPLTDKVEVQPPDTKDYSISLKYYISSEDMESADNVRSKVRNAVREYAKWQSGKIGRDINPDKLRNLILNAGASRVEMTTPVFTSIESYQVANLTSSIASDEEIDTVAKYGGESE